LGGSLVSALPSAPDFFPERLDRVHSFEFFLTQPPMRGGDVDYPTYVDDLQNRHGIWVAAPSELCNRYCIEVEPPDLVHEVDNDKHRSQRMESDLSLFLDIGLDRE